MPDRCGGTDSGNWKCRTAEPGRPSGSTRPSPTASRRPARASDPASELSFDDILQHLAIERQIGNDLLEPAVLIIQLAQPPHLRWPQPRVLLLPVEVGRLTDPRLEIGRAHVLTPVTNAHLVCRLLLEKKKQKKQYK